MPSAFNTLTIRRRQAASMALLAPLSLLYAAVRLVPWLYVGMLTIFLFRPPDVDLYGADRWTFAIVAGIGLVRMLTSARGLPSPVLLLPMGALVALTVGGAALQPYNAQTWSLLAAKFVEPYILFWLAGAIFATEEAQNLLRTFIFAALAYLIFTALAQFAGADSLVFPRYILDSSLGIHAGRARGPLLQAVANGVMLNFFGLIALQACLKQQWRGLACKLLLLTLPLAILATMTRAVWISFVVSVGARLAKQGSPPHRWRLAAATAVILVLGVALVSVTGISQQLEERAGEPGPVEIRMAVYQAAASMIAERPLLGWGPNRMPGEVAKRMASYRLQAYWAHNTYLEILVEQGLVGLALYLSVFWGLFRLRKSPAQDADSTFTASLREIWPILLGVYAFNACFVVMNYQFVNAVLFTLGGILAASHSRTSAENSPEHSFDFAHEI